MGNMSKMTKLVVILLIATIASFAIAGFIFFGEYGANNFAGLNEDTFKPSGSVEVDEEKSQPIAGIENIHIGTSSDKINIIKTDSDELKAHFHGYYTSNSKDYKPEFTFTSNGSEVRIRVDYKPYTGALMYNSNLRLDVYLPAKYSKNLDIETSSADINIDGINALESFACKMASGNLEAGAVNAGTARLEASSGSATITGEYGSFEWTASGEFTSEGIKADSASLRTTSGNIRLKGSIGDLELNSTSGEVLAEQLIAGTCKVETSSGSITLKGNPGKLEASASSGEIRLQYDEFASDITLKTSSSGNAFIKLPQDAQFRLDYDTTSGDKKIDFPITINGNSEGKGIHGTVVSDRNSIKVSTSSGSLEITK